MTLRRTFAAALVGLLPLVGLAAPAAAQEPKQTGQDDSQAVAVNTTDGASVFRLAFSVRYVADGVVDQTNTAVALASCTACRTVALAFQVVLVDGDADVVTPENRAAAVNVACEECLTYASATQIVLGVDGPVRLTGEGHRRLAQLAISLRRLERDIETIDPNALLAEVHRAQEELRAIFTEELRRIGPPDRAGDEEVTSTTTTTTTDGSGDDEPSTTTTTTERPAGSSTSTSAPSTTTTTDAPTTTTTAAG